MSTQFCVIHINWFMGAVTPFFSSPSPPQRGHIDWPIFWNIGHSPIETPLWTPIAKFQKMFLYKYSPFSLFTWELNFGVVDPSQFSWLIKRGEENCSYHMSSQLCVIGINQFMGVITLFLLFSFLEGGTLIGQFFWNIGHSPIETPLWTPVTK